MTKSISLSTIISTREFYLGKLLIMFFKGDSYGIIVSIVLFKTDASLLIYLFKCGAPKFINPLLGYKSPIQEFIPTRRRIENR